MIWTRFLLNKYTYIILIILSGLFYINSLRSDINELNEVISDLKSDKTVLENTINDMNITLTIKEEYCNNQMKNLKTLIQSYQKNINKKSLSDIKNSKPDHLIDNKIDNKVLDTLLGIGK